MAKSGGMISQIYVNITTNITALKAALRNALSAIAKFTRDVAKYALGNILADSLKSMFAGMVGGFSNAIERAASLNETISKTKAMMGENADAAIKFAQQMESRGVASAQTVLDSFSSTFAALRNQGFSDKEAYDYAAALEERMADIGSQQNKTAEEVRDTVRSGLQGQFDTLSNVGVFTSAEQLDQRVAASGRGGTATPMGQRRERSREMINEIMRQTASSKGDFEATKYSYANQKRTGDVKSNAVSTRIGQDLLAVGQAFQYFRNKFLSVMLAVANTGAFKKIGDMLTQAVSYVGMAFETVLPQIIATLTGWLERFVEGIKFMATAVMAVITKPKAVMELISGMIKLAGVNVADALNWAANKITLGAVGRQNFDNQRDQARSQMDAAKTEISAKRAEYDAELKTLLAKFEAGASQAAGPLAPQQQISEGVKSSQSAFNSLLSGVFGNGAAYQNQMLAATKQIAENTKPQQTGVQQVTGKTTLATTGNPFLEGL